VNKFLVDCEHKPFFFTGFYHEKLKKAKNIPPFSIDY